MITKENKELIFQLSIPTFILLGLAKVSAYYNQFHLPIIEYLSFSEMITIFLNNIYVYATLILNYAIFFFLNDKHFRGSLSIIILAFLLIFTFNFLSGNFRFDISNLLIATTGILAIFFLILSLSPSSVYNYLASLGLKTSKFYIATFVLLILLVVSSFQGMFEAKQVKSKHIYTGTSIRMKSGEVVSNDTTYFIGKTNDYIFFYNDINKHVYIYPIQEIEAMHYVTKSMY